MTASEPTDCSRAWVDVDLDALVANARMVATAAGRPLLPMVKANGYGLGAVRVARALEVLEPWGFGVATVGEGVELRAAGIARRIVVFTPLLTDLVDAYVEHRLRPAIGDTAALRRWVERTERPFHLEIDTGMSRAGIRWDDDAALAAATLALRGASGWEGVFTHFHSAESDAAATATQWQRLQGALERLPHRPPLVHAANSAGSLRGAAYAGDLVRPGIHLYGGIAGEPAPRPVARLRARVVATRRIAAGDTVSYGGGWRAERETLVATLGIGYADGVLRSLGDRGLVELGGRVHPIVGRVTMDMTMVAIEGGAVAPGDVATLYGGLVSLEAQAAAAGTISYELLTALGARVARHYGRVS